MTVITAIGVIGHGAAPPETIDHLMHALPKGGLLGFSLNDHTLNDYRFIPAACQIGWTWGLGVCYFANTGPICPEWT